MFDSTRWYGYQSQHTPAEIERMKKLIDDLNEYNIMSKAHNPYGDGKACEKIVNFIKETK